MVLHRLIFVLAFGCCFISPIFAGTERGSRLIDEAGGSQGVPGAAGPARAPGIAVAAGAAGIPGINGVPGAPGILDFTDFFALMPGDNLATVEPGGHVFFPQIGSTNGVIVPTNPGTMSGTFLLPVIGSYLVLFQASIDEGALGNAQLQLRLNGVPIANSVAGRDIGTDQVVGVSIVTTTSTNSIIEVINPPTATTAFTLTPIAGGTHSVSAHLVIIRIR